MNSAETGSSATGGVYLVYLFAHDGSAVYLALGQGITKMQGGRAALAKRSLDLRDVLAGLSGLTTRYD